MKEYVKAFDPWMVRNVDFVPVLSLQAGIDKGQELYYLKGIFSEMKSSIEEPIETELGGMIKPMTTTGHGAEIKYGNINPEMEYRLTPKEILRDIEGYEILDMVIHRKGTIHKIPRSIEDMEQIGGSDYLYHQQSSVGNRDKKIRRLTGIPVISPYRTIESELLVHRKIFRRPKVIHSGLRKIRSVLKTDWILPSDTMGWENLRHALLPVERAIRGKQQGKTMGKNWWQDTAMPHTISGRIDSRIINVRICQLDDRRSFIGI